MKSRSKASRTPENDKPCTPTPALVLDFTNPVHVKLVAETRSSLTELDRAIEATRQTVWTEFRQDQFAMLQRKAAAKLMPAKQQLPCDIGLFSDDADQLDLVQWLTEQSED